MILLKFLLVASRGQHLLNVCFSSLRHCKCLFSVLESLRRCRFGKQMIHHADMQSNSRIDSREALTLTGRYDVAFINITDDWDTAFYHIPVRYAVPLVWGQPAPSNRPPSSLSRWWTAKDSWSSASTAAETVHLVHSPLAGIYNKEVPAMAKKADNTVIIMMSSHWSVTYSNQMSKKWEQTSPIMSCASTFNSMSFYFKEKSGDIIYFSYYQQIPWKDQHQQWIPSPMLLPCLCHRAPLLSKNY